MQTGSEGILAEPSISTTCRNGEALFARCEECFLVSPLPLLFGSGPKKLPSLTNRFWSLISSAFWHSDWLIFECRAQRLATRTKQNSQLLEGRTPTPP
jgi:hypothetical protein